MSRALNDLSSTFRPLAVELIARLIERGLMVMIIDTLRTEDEHRANLANGTSKALKSRHLPRRLRMPMHLTDPDREKSDAIDLCPFSVYDVDGPDKLNWDPAHPAWKVVGEEVRRLGLTWGGDFQTLHDPGHAELPARLMI